ncbi:MAG TPA: hypothetical protein VHP33_02640 [Polyangiaceae bacterium]|nr:hypothetical protein [Polyangiaceae bacterium]
MRALVGFVLLLSFGAGCSSNDAAGDAPPSLGGSSSVGGQPTAGSQPTSIEFESVGDLPARAQVLVKVKVLPPQAYAVRFALPTSGGDPLDAVLDQALVTADSDGIASVKLTAPSTPAEFDVRASVGTISRTLRIRVTESGFASLLVQPKYAGFRQITTWVASAHLDTTCASLTGIPPEDGPLVSLPAASGSAPQLDDVPAGTRLAVTLRSGHFVGGCASVEKTRPGSPSNPQFVQVTVLNRPLNLSASTLNLSLGLPADDTSWSAFLQQASDAVLAALLGTSTDDVDALLDAMREASGASRQSFENARKTEVWDDLLRAHWGLGAATKVHEVYKGWLTAGRQRFSESAHLFTGTLAPIEQPGNPLDQRSADLTLLTVADLPAKQGGFVERAKVSWSAGADDSILLGTDLYVVQSQLMSGLAEAALLKANPEVADGPALLAETLDCDGLSGVLAAAGASAELGYDSCNASCLTTLCESAVAALWQRGADATGLAPARLSINATGERPLVGDAAQLVGVGGTWLGVLTANDEETATGGNLTAVAPTAE